MRQTPARAGAQASIIRTAAQPQRCVVFPKLIFPPRTALATLDIPLQETARNPAAARERFRNIFSGK